MLQPQPLASLARFGRSRSLRTEEGKCVSFDLTVPLSLPAAKALQPLLLHTYFCTRIAAHHCCSLPGSDLLYR
ncbi:hypothetical protein K239x_33260 [Planctomycetes bacterium K23_9]|uniref:Uncharacterized protein n=1 Tax=Stieleria marina TaxID=1930275 RepID=A0A517NW30_9BACT|nr:hypothetical protein K239x_33260 [Planctomycetes bacterium K23_9]